ncbi:hypothetical protein KOR34_13370 [Posidoniimonas corsicana]|uniref:4Fe-4S ferredoxin-type domain-containing protein n=1 Tax=Posidoniimonas corsicana TaxID=1938618 RepID=A0A5C5VFJ9_9BACT|nr:hypothetical protein [Posidoniimonas corsicana]TWT36432.1 hypothetical protein KOR34_13370 [Posidoniimonas corsicana]
MKTYLLMLSAAAMLFPAAGCTVGLPRGPIEPSITADCVDYLNENWIPASHTSAAPCDGTCSEPAPAPAAAQPAGCYVSGDCPISCRDCPLIPNPGSQPPYVDPGPPGRFLPVPVRPAFAPQPIGYPASGPVGW